LSDWVCFPVAVEAAKGVAAVALTAEEEDLRIANGFCGDAAADLRQMYLVRKRKPKLQELATFTQQLANLLQAGMPLTVALNSMTHLESKGIPPRSARTARQEVMEGGVCPMPCPSNR
jgi:type II secretory pathway component PulF